MRPTNELYVTPGGKGWFLFELVVRAPFTPELMISLQRKNRVDLKNISLILQESSGLSLPRVIESITLGNKSLLLSSVFLNTSLVIFGNKNKLLNRK
jgi:hypothetical protein